MMTMLITACKVMVSMVISMAVAIIIAMMGMVRVIVMVMD